MSEELKLVTDFGELKAGMIVVGKPCGICNGIHRGVLISAQECPADGRCFILLPAPICAAEECHIGPTAVKAGRMFRVIDGLESSSHAAIKKMVRA